MWWPRRPCSDWQAQSRGLLVLVTETRQFVCGFAERRPTEERAGSGYCSVFVRISSRATQSLTDSRLPWTYGQLKLCGPPGQSWLAGIGAERDLRRWSGLCHRRRSVGLLGDRGTAGQRSGLVRRRPRTAGSWLRPLFP